MIEMVVTRSAGKKPKGQKSPFLSSRTAFSSSLNLDTPDLEAVTQSLANAKFTNARKGPNTERLHAQHKGKPRRGQTMSYPETKSADKKRKGLLRDARRLSPIDTVLRVDKLRNSALFQLFRHPVVWLILLVYTGTATATRYGYMTFHDLDREAFEGSSTLITFMIVFYVGCASGSLSSPSRAARHCRC